MVHGSKQQLTNSSNGLPMENRLSSIALTSYASGMGDRPRRVNRRTSVAISSAVRMSGAK
jgi:hypothetical protein